MNKKDEKIVKNAVKGVAFATGHPEVPLAMKFAEAALKEAKRRKRAKTARRYHVGYRRQRRRGLGTKLLKGY